MNKLSLMFLSLFLLTLGSLEARGGGGHGGGGGGHAGGGAHMGGYERGVGGVGREGAYRGEGRAFDRGLEAGAIEGGEWGGGGYYPYGEGNYNAFPDDDQDVMDDGAQIYKEDEVNNKGPN
jgi:hypothetical protein